MLKLVGVPLFDLPVLPRCEEQMSLGHELEEHDAVEMGGKVSQTRKLRTVGKIESSRKKTDAQRNQETS